MPAVLVYNNQAGQMEKHELSLNDPMPYVNGNTLTVREFRGKSGSNLMWTDRRAMESWNRTRAAFGPIYVGYAFRRIGENGHANQSQHYAGMSFDVSQNIGNEGRARLRNTAANLGVWTYIEPAYLTPTWVHFDRRLAPPACSSGGYPLVKQGSRGVYVCTLQDALSTVGVSGAAIDGVFGAATRDAVKRFQRQNGLGADGVAGCMTWQRLTAMAKGAWRS